MRHIVTETDAGEKEHRTITKEAERNKHIKTENIKTLRPSDFSGYIGQEKVKAQILTAVQSALIRKTAVPHILLYGAPGLGKTTIARLVADAVGSRLVEITGPSIEKPADATSVIYTLKDRDVLFIDEIHRMDKKAEEMLYSAMEDMKLHLTVGVGEQAKVVSLDLPAFTLIGATTRAGMISAPLRDRFQIICKMEYYSDEELSLIGKNTAEKLGITVPDTSLMLLAHASRGTPRIMNNNILRIRDYCTVHNNGEVTDEAVKAALELSGIDENGLKDIDRNVLTALAETEKPVGLSTLSHILGEDEGTIEDMVEPYLLMEGYIIKTPKGRLITDKGKELYHDQYHNV